MVPRCVAFVALALRWAGRHCVKTGFPVEAPIDVNEPYIYIYIYLHIYL